MGIRVDGAASTTSTATKTSLETEVNSRCFKLNHAYFISLNSTKGLYLKDCIEDQENKKEIVPVLHKT